MSQAITAIERQAGESLRLRRKAHGFLLTASGHHFAQMARKILSRRWRTERHLPAKRRKITRPGALWPLRFLSPHLIPATLEGFKHPDVQLEVRAGTYAELLPALRNGELDVAFVYDLSLPADLDKQEIYRTEMQVVLHPEHRLAKLKRPLELADLGSKSRRSCTSPNRAPITRCSSSPRRG